MDILQTVEETVKKYYMLYGGERVLVALSGGPDSVCLLHLLCRMRQNWRLSLSALYIDHGLRENTSDEIEFCSKLCKELGVDFLSLSIDVRGYASDMGLSIQEAARILRYRALEEEAIRQDADRIATGHHADDQAETLLIRLLRGTGPIGLAGIPPVRGKIIRPLIELQRWMIEDYLREQGLRYLIDPSNLKKDYLRNRIRHELMPILKRYNPRVVSTLLRTSQILREENDFINIQVTKALMRLISRKDDERVELFLTPMENLDRVILRRALLVVINEVRGLRGISSEHIEQIIDLVKEGRTGARLYLPDNVRVIKGYSTLTITSRRPEVVKEQELKIPGETIVKEASVVLISSVHSEVDALGDGKTMAVFDADTLQMPLKIRARRPGDYFYPFGLAKKKKLQDFFVDEKVPRDQRDSVPILVSGDQIVWVVGYRMDDRFKVTPSSRRILKVIVRMLRD
ncbi:MAG: tRNA lysidine(34) synthetase TilS [Nitrospirae bacterium]|nr:MAG: tRNA lysidine(34) synthetase TilS [Nitrospirota bacterium]